MLRLLLRALDIFSNKPIDSNARIAKEERAVPISSRVATMSLKEHYEKISEAARAVRQHSLGEEELLKAGHIVIDEIRLWQNVLGSRPEASIFGQIVSGLELGIFALVSGLYRQAYGSLRLAVELTAGICWFSTHRLDLAEWQSGERDLVWKEITNPEEGVLSPRYRKAFFPELNNEERKYDGLNKKLYRELSEYVHGNAGTWTGAGDIKYDERLYKEWFERLDIYMVVTTVLLSLRYLQEIENAALADLAPGLHARVGHVAAISKYLEERIPNLSANVAVTATVSPVTSVTTTAVALAAAPSADAAPEALPRAETGSNTADDNASR